MKDGICPKCSGQDIYATRDNEHIENSPINDRRLIALKIYACGGCGYLEQYIQKHENLEKLSSLKLVEKI